MKRRGILDRLQAIPVPERCPWCAGFGFVYRTNLAGTVIIQLKCVSCNRTGRLTPPPAPR